MAKVMIFIDANFFNQILNKHYGKNTWLVDKLITLLAMNRDVVHTFYYVNKFKLNPLDIAKQQNFLKTIERKIPNLTAKAFEMQKKKDGEGYEEKGVDNEITLDMTLEINRYDIGILVAEDKDYVGTVMRIIEKGKEIEVAIPFYGKGHHIRQVCTRPRILSDRELRTIFKFPIV